MAASRNGRFAWALFVLVSMCAPRAWAQQATGHKILGTLGVNAGVQPETGVYVVEQFLFYHADEVVSQNGTPLPGGYRLDAVSNAIGVAGVYRLPHTPMYLGAAFGAPLSRVTVSSDLPQANIDRFGLGDLYVQPCRLGWKLSHLDLVTSYSLYVPTATFEPGPHGSVSRSHYSQEMSLGGAVYFDEQRTWQLSALGSYELNGPKLGIDITRGDTVQVQGGVGKQLWRALQLGLDGYALFQVRDDRGAALPPVLVGLRERTYGIGGELIVTIAQARARVTLRYAHDLGAEARTQGQLLLVNITFAPLQKAKRTRR